MGAGDVTVLGPYTIDATGVAAADIALTAAQSGAATDKIFSIADNNTFYIFYVEGA